MINWANHILALTDALEEGMRHHTDTFGEPVVGPVDWNAISFPAVHVLPDTSNHAGGNEYDHSGFLNFYFSRSKSTEYRDHLLLVADSLSSVMDSLEADENVVEFKPTRVENYAGQLDDTLLIKIEVEFTASTLVDFPMS